MSMLKLEACRRGTFGDDWPHRDNPNLTKERMAAAGFFYTGVGDLVQCVFCLQVIGEWDPTDVPMLEHRRHTIHAPVRRHCPFAAGMPTGNIPESFPTHSADEWVDVTPLRGQTPGIIPMQANLTPVLVKPKPPATPSMKMLTAREASFKDWPAGMSHVDTKAMAEAGFFFTGILYFLLEIT
jgi:hypothetical protein